ncbi:MAG: peptidoglycan editing factor PgeF [Burkholderiales bacterium]|nr:peptidoglycan editing factor PgeF [Burkholderiales bacterium]
MSLRTGGVSHGPWASLNLGLATGDDAAAVEQNRRRFAAALGARPVWLRQVHGTAVLQLTPSTPDRPAEAADAAWTLERGLACTVQAADCLPVLLALRDGRAVAAAHAGWRGLAAGVLEAAVRALCEGSGAGPEAVQAWLGPCIGPRQFEVGADVLRAFGVDPAAADGLRFRSRPRADGAPRWLANLPQLARDRLAGVGVRAVSGGDACTVEDSSRFFSFRRDRVTGRLAAAIWRG